MNIIFATCNFGIFGLIVLFVVLLARHLAVSQVLKADRDEISFEDKLGLPLQPKVDPGGISQSVEVIDGTAVYFLLPEFFLPK